jgi:hypothetical protein
MTGGNVKVVCSWIGNSPAVAMQHYALITEADIQEVVKMSLINNTKERVQITAAPTRTESQEPK